MYNIKYKILSFMLLVSVLVSTLYVGMFVAKATDDTAKRSISYRVQEALGGEEFAEIDFYSNTVKLLQDVKLTETLIIDKGINIDLNTKTIESEVVTAFNINCSDSESLTVLEDSAIAEDSSINIFNGTIISADGYNGVEVTKGVVKLSDVEIQAKKSSPDNSTGSNAVYVKPKDSNSSVTIENSKLSCNSEDISSYGLYIDNESNANIKLSDSTIERVYIPTGLSVSDIIADGQESNQDVSLSGTIENLIIKTAEVYDPELKIYNEFGITADNAEEAEDGPILTATADENIVITGNSLVEYLGGLNYAQVTTSEKHTGEVGSMNVTNTVYTVTLKQDVILRKPIRLVSEGAPKKISSYIIDLDGYKISADSGITGTGLIYIGGTSSYRGPGKVEIKNGVIDCSSASGVTALQLGTMMSKAYTTTSGNEYDFSSVGVDSTVKFKGITAVGGKKDGDKTAGDAVMAPILTMLENAPEAWPHLIVDGSNLIGGKGVGQVTNPAELATYGYGLNIVSPTGTSPKPNETIVDLRADTGDTYINRLFRTTIGTDGGRKVLRDGNDELTHTSGFVDNSEFFVQTREYQQLTNDINPTDGNINIYSPAYPRDVSMTDNFLSESGNSEEQVNVIVRKVSFIITIPEEVEVGNEGDHTPLSITAQEVVLPNTKKVQVSVQGDKMQKNGADILGVTLSQGKFNFTTSLSVRNESGEYNIINWENGGLYPVTAFDNKVVTAGNPKSYNNLCVDGINPMVPVGDYEGKLTFTANIVDA